MDGRGERHGAIYAGSPGNLRLVAEEDDPVTDLFGFRLGPPILVREISGTGSLAFTAFINRGLTTELGLFTNRGGAPELLLRTGEPLPTEPGRTLTSFPSIPTMDRDGRLSIVAISSSFRTIITERDGDWSTVARHGDAPVGLPADTYTRLDQPIGNAAGELAFQACLNAAGPFGDDDQVIVFDTRGAQTIIARSGWQAPDLPPGIVYGALTLGAMNDPGQIVFLAELAGPGVDISSNLALFMTNRRGKPRLLARAGDTFEVRPGDVRTILRPAAISVFATQLLSLNDRGKLAFIVTLVGGETAVLEATIREKVSRARIR